MNGSRSATAVAKRAVVIAHRIGSRPEPPSQARSLTPTRKREAGLKPPHQNLRPRPYRQGGQGADGQRVDLSEVRAVQVAGETGLRVGSSIAGFGDDPSLRLDRPRQDVRDQPSGGADRVGQAKATSQGYRFNPT